MEKKTIIEGISYLSSLYPSALKEIDYELMINVWYDYFKEIDENHFKMAVKNYKGQYFPNAPQLMVQIEKYQDPHKARLNAEEEFDKFRQAIRRLGCNYREEEIYQSLDPYTRVIARRIGAKRVGLSDLDQLPFIKKEFINEFNEGKERYDEYVEESKMLESDNANKVIEQIAQSMKLEIGE